ncbi:uncharacterized protein FTOL_11439 [Fusarium torulosum]|uniref:RRM domain-containing protein n=1 Tax=Fusarium torulosum TaxID=33205 RepID=A0AAE8MIZ9_9HYPO|nr:uncharacterized protein FTOL_11439 [Fusarium torulosum]
MTEGTVNGLSTSTTNGDIPHHGFADGAVPSSTRNSHHVIANGSSLPMQNRAPHGVIIVNGNTQSLGSSGIANRLPHDAQLYATHPAQGIDPRSVEQIGLLSPPRGPNSTSQPGSQHSARSGPASGGQRFFTPNEPSNNHSYNPGLPQSVSYSSGLALLSPGHTHTPHQLSGNGGMGESLSSPIPGHYQHQTEPRNYAPRTSGQPVNALPPPRFNLNLQAMSSASQTSPQDPFGSPERVEPTALIPFPTLPPPAVQQAMLAAPMPVQFIGNKSQKLAELTCTFSGFPALGTAMSPEYFPFISGPGSAKPSTGGVVRLKNIPFSTKRSEVVAFIGRNSRMLSDGEEPIHIIMDRATSKTMDAFVEFVSMEDAMRCAEKHHQNIQLGRVSRLGERPVEVELSSQAALMQDLFPLARGVFWDGASPQILPHNPVEPWANFKGFISPEEMVMLVKHVEVPHRSPFSKECPQRPYECLISTLRKFPWFAANYVTISQRGAMYKATIKLIRLLSKSMAQQDDPVNLNSSLFQRIIRTAMDCKGFTVLQKDNIAFMVQLAPPMEQQRRHGQPLNPNSWVHQYAIMRKPEVPLDVVDWYIRLIREQTTRDILVLPIHERTAIQETLEDTDDYWGYFFHEVNYIQGPQFDHMSLGDCAYLELSAIERILGRALGYN